MTDANTLYYDVGGKTQSCPMRFCSRPANMMYERIAAVCNYRVLCDDSIYKIVPIHQRARLRGLRTNYTIPLAAFHISTLHSKRVFFFNQTTLFRFISSTFLYKHLLRHVLRGGGLVPIMDESRGKIALHFFGTAVKAEIYFRLAECKKFTKRSGADETDARLTGLGIMAVGRCGII